jgi:hypothetical protein
MRRACLLLFLVAATVDAQTPASVRIPIRGRGAVVLTLPSGWTGNVMPAAAGRPPTAELKSGAAGGPMMLVSAVGSDDPAFATAASLHAVLVRSSSLALASSVQKELPLTEFHVRGATGYWFHATDRAPKAGEYEQLVNGMLPVGDVVLDFTILSHETAPASTTVPLSIIESARQETAPAAASSHLKTVVVADEGWHITFDAPPLRDEHESTSNGYAYKANSGLFNMSLFVEKPSGDGTTNRDVYDFYWPQAKRNPMIDQKSVVMSSTPKYVRVQYDIHADMKGEDITQRNVNYYFAFRGRWVDVHISFVEPTKADDAIFTRFDESLTYAAP